MTTMRCLVAIASVLSLARCSKSAEAEKHMIPEGYSGHVVIAHVTEGGNPPRYEGNARIYEIPETGFLLSNSQPNPGLGRLEFYSRQPGGQPKRITLAIGGKKQDGAVQVYGMFTGWYGNAGEQCSIPYESYFVGSYEDYVKVRDETEPDFRLVEIWKRCREAAGV